MATYSYVQKTIRIYRQHDMDLVSLYRTKKYHLGREMKRALIAFATGEVYKTSPVEPSPIDGYVPKTMMLHLSFNPNKEDERKALEILDEVKDGYMTSFVKAVFRGSVAFLPLYAYSDSNSMRVRKNRYRFYPAQFENQDKDTQNAETNKVNDMRQKAVNLSNNDTSSSLDDEDLTFQKSADVNQVIQVKGSINEANSSIMSHDSNNENINNDNNDEDLMSLFMQMSDLAH